jgi:hypothetical protein
MAKTPSQVGLLAATDPRVLTSQAIGGDATRSPMFQGQDPWGNQGTPGGPVMSPEWSQFFDALRQYAPGGITAPRGKKPPVAEED